MLSCVGYVTKKDIKLFIYGQKVDKFWIFAFCLLVRMDHLYKNRLELVCTALFLILCGYIHIGYFLNIFTLMYYI